MTTYTRRPNPWNLSGGQIAALEAMVECCVLKIAAQKLGVGQTDISQQIKRAADLMNVKRPLAAILEWDRWTRKERQYRAADDETVRRLQEALK